MDIKFSANMTIYNDLLCDSEDVMAVRRYDGWDLFTKNEWECNSVSRWSIKGDSLFLEGDAVVGHTKEWYRLRWHDTGDKNPELLTVKISLIPKDWKREHKTEVKSAVICVLKRLWRDIRNTEATIVHVSQDTNGCVSCSMMAPDRIRSLVDKITNEVENELKKRKATKC